MDRSDCGGAKRRTELGSPLASEAFESGGDERETLPERIIASPFQRAFEGEAAGYRETQGVTWEDEDAKGLDRKLVNLALLPHSWRRNGREVELIPASLTLPIYDGPDKFKIDPALALQTCLTEVMNAKFPHMKAAVVDLTKGDSQVQFAGYAHSDQVDVKDIPKLAVLLAAFQLRHDLCVLSNDTKPDTADSLFRAARNKWAEAARQILDIKHVKPGPSGHLFVADRIFAGDRIVYIKDVPKSADWHAVPLIEPKAPRLEDIFTWNPGGSCAVDFKSSGQDRFDVVKLANDASGNAESRRALAARGFRERLRLMIGGDNLLEPIADFVTGGVIRDIGYEYIASTLLGSGLYDPGRGGGLWLGDDYGAGVWKHKAGTWHGALTGGGARSATAGSLAALLLLLATNELVDAQASAEIRDFMQPDLLDAVRHYAGFKEGLAQLPDAGSVTSIASIGGFTGRFADDAALIERSLGTDKPTLRYVAVGLRGHSSKDLMTLILELDKCVLANNGLAPTDGGHTHEIWSEHEQRWDETSDPSSEHESGDPGVALTEEEIGHFGQGSRTRVVDTIKRPFRWVCQILATRRITSAAGSERHAGLSPVGSGLLISPRHVLTAAHVLHCVDDSQEEQAETVYVEPGHGDESGNPFGRIEVRSWVLHPKWRPTIAGRKGEARHDYALITLDSPVGDKMFKALGGDPLGFWGSPAQGGNTVLDAVPTPVAVGLLGGTIVTGGYPGSAKGAMWCFTGKATTGTAEVDTRLASSGQAKTWVERNGTFHLFADAERGQSGSPVWMLTDSKRRLVGVLVDAGDKFNTAAALTDDMVRQIRTWINEPEHETEAWPDYAPEAAGEDGSEPEMPEPALQALLEAQESLARMPSPVHAWDTEPGAMEDEIPMPSGASRFRHFFQPMKASGATWVPDGEIVQLNPINPGFVDDKDNLIEGPLQQPLADLLTGSDDFKPFLTAETVRTGKPRVGDKIQVALVDLTGGKLTKPEFAGFGSTVGIEVGSAAKVGALYAAFQLLADLKHIAAIKSINTVARLVTEAARQWRGTAHGSGPDVATFLNGAADPPALAFSADISRAVANIINNNESDPDNANVSADRLLRVIGFPYVASLMWQSGLRHAKRGGLWLRWGFDPEHVLAWADPVLPPPGPFSGGHAGNALSLATFFTLLAQGRLVDAASCAEMKKRLSTASFFEPRYWPATPIPHAAIASKVGLVNRCTKWLPKQKDGRPKCDKHSWVSTLANEGALIENGKLRYAVAVMTEGIDHGITVLQQLIGPLNNMISTQNP